MHGWDLFIGFVLLWGIYSGVKSGIVVIAGDIIGLVLGWWVGTHYAQPLGQLVMRMDITKTPHYANLIAAAILYTICFTAVHVIAGGLSKEMDQLFPIRFLNHATGGFLGLLKGILLLSPLLFPMIYFQLPVVQKSWLLRHTNRIVAPQLHRVSMQTLKPYLDKDFYERMQRRFEENTDSSKLQSKVRDALR